MKKAQKPLRIFARCPDCGMRFEIPIRFKGRTNNVVLLNNMAICPHCDGIAQVPNGVILNNAFYAVFGRVRSALEATDDPVEMVRTVHKFLSEIKGGQHKSGLEKLPGYALAKKCGLTPRRTGEAAAIAGLLWAMLKWWTAHPEKEKAKEVPSPSTVVNIYNEMYEGGKVVGSRIAPSPTKLGKPHPAGKPAEEEKDEVPE